MLSHPLEMHQIDSESVVSLQRRKRHIGRRAFGIVPGARRWREGYTDMTLFSRRHVLLGAGATAFAASLTATGRAAGSTTFTVMINNVATDKTLKLPDGGTSGAPIAPGVFVVSSTPHLLFMPGMQASEELERLAEDGNFQPLLDKVRADKSLASSGMFLPGQPFAFTASPGDRLQFATMFVQSNDLFFAPRSGGIALFDAGGRAMHGKVTSQVALFDAGTEVNQAPGVGPDQAPRQVKPDTGLAEQVAIAVVADRRDGFAYPPVEAVIDVEIMPLAAGRKQS